MSLFRQISIIMAGAVMLASCSSPPSSSDNGTSPAVATSSSTAVPADHEAMAAGADLGGIIDEYCTKCHNFEDYAGGIDLEGLGPENIQLVPDIGERVIRRLRAGMMPPPGEPRPDVETMQSLASALENQIDANAEFEPGRPGLHRLNRTEYANAIRDLLALEVNAADFLPTDDSSNGFDNQAGSLTLSPTLLEAYLTAAAKISLLAVGESSGPTQALYRTAEDANQNFRIEGLPFGTRGGIKFTHIFPVDGEYNFKTFAITLGNMGSSRAFGSVSGEKLEVLIDGELVKVFDWDEDLTRSGFNFNDDVDEDEDNAAPRPTLPTLDVMVPVSAGPHEVAVTFQATNYAPGLDMNNDFERSTIETGGIPGFTWYPHVGSVRVEGPYNASGASDSPSRQKIFTCLPANASEEEACAREITEDFIELAYRGYDTEEDVEKLMAFYELGRESGDFDNGIAIMMQRVLTDPKFIYRIEKEPENLAAGEVYQIDDLDLAARLSFFLWSSIPDKELLDLAKADRLSSERVLDQQVRRMLDDPKSSAFTENFAGQWLALRNLATHAPVVDQFPDFDNLLRRSLERETELLFDSLIREDRPITDLLTADYTFVNERLAMHYGIPGIKGERFRRVELDGDLAVRAGILGKGSMLTVASQPGRTSPVMRGYWVLSNIIGVEPPPPPPNVPDLPVNAGDNAGNTAIPSMREQMEAHRANPACQGCHRLMDPIGFALETFDAVGKYRTQENGNVIDTSGQLYDGSSLEDTTDLMAFLQKYRESMARNVTQRLLTYAVGRGMEDEDMPLVRQVQHEAAKDNYRFQSLISAVVSSEAFLMNESGGGESQANLTEQAETVVASATGGF